MRRSWLLGGAALALCSTLVMAQQRPESLLPPGFDDPAPTPTASPSPRPQQPDPSAPAPSTSTPVIQPVPGTGTDGPASTPDLPIPGNLPSLEELEKLGTDELDELLGLKPRFDIPPAARR